MNYKNKVCGKIDFKIILLTILQNILGKMIRPVLKFYFSNDSFRSFETGTILWFTIYTLYVKQFIIFLTIMIMLL